jgi:hypothetical protein
MKAHIFENVENLNKFISKKKDVCVKFKSFIVDEKKDENGSKIYDVIDRFLVIAT